MGALLLYFKLECRVCRASARHIPGARVRQGIDAQWGNCTQRQVSKKAMAQKIIYMPEQKRKSAIAQILQM